MARFGRMTVLVHDLDAASAFYRDGFGFAVLFDGEVAPGLRTVHLGSDGPRGAGLWLLQASGPQGEERVGRQTGGEPAMVVYTEDLAGDLGRLAGLDCVPIVPTISDAAGSQYAHVRDVSGIEIVVVQLPAAGAEVAYTLVTEPERDA